MPSKSAVITIICTATPGVLLLAVLGPQTSPQANLCCQKGGYYGQEPSPFPVTGQHTSYQKKREGKSGEAHRNQRNKHQSKAKNNNFHDLPQIAPNCLV